jgi:beta-glucosidase-like glycosyl hydrolase
LGELLSTVYIRDHMLLPFCCCHQVVATCKHFLGYGLEGAEGVSRYSHNLDLAPQDLADTDLPPFEACVQVRRDERALAYGHYIWTR